MPGDFGGQFAPVELYLNFMLGEAMTHGYGLVVVKVAWHMAAPLLPWARTIHCILASTVV